MLYTHIHKYTIYTYTTHIIIQCLIGYAPFYADDPVSTCKRILRWQQTYHVPPVAESTLSPECVSFLSALITSADNRLVCVVYSV